MIYANVIWYFFFLLGVLASFFTGIMGTGSKNLQCLHHLAILTRLHSLRADVTLFKLSLPDSSKLYSTLTVSSELIFYSKGKVLDVS